MQQLTERPSSRSPDEYEGPSWPAIEDYVSSGANTQSDSADGATDEPEPPSCEPPSANAVERRIFLSTLQQKFFTHAFSDKRTNYAIFVYLEGAWRYGSDLVKLLGHVYARHSRIRAKSIAKHELGQELVEELHALMEEGLLEEVGAQLLSEMREHAEKGIFYRDGSFVSPWKGGVGIQLPAPGGSVVFHASNDGGRWEHNSSATIFDGRFGVVRGKWKPFVLEVDLQTNIGKGCMNAGTCIQLLSSLWSSSWSGGEPAAAAVGHTALSFRHFQSQILGSDDIAKEFVKLQSAYIRGELPEQGKTTVVFYSGDDERGRCKTTMLRYQKEFISKTLFALSNDDTESEIMEFMASTSKDPARRKKVRHHYFACMGGAMTIRLQKPPPWLTFCLYCCPHRSFSPQCAGGTSWLWTR